MMQCSGGVIEGGIEVIARMRETSDFALIAVKVANGELYRATAVTYRDAVRASSLRDNRSTLARLYRRV